MDQVKDADRPGDAGRAGETVRGGDVAALGIWPSWGGDQPGQVTKVGI